MPLSSLGWEEGKGNVVRTQFLKMVREVSWVGWEDALLTCCGNQTIVLNYIVVYLLGDSVIPEHSSFAFRVCAYSVNPGFLVFFNIVKSWSYYSLVNSSAQKFSLFLSHSVSLSISVCFSVCLSVSVSVCLSLTHTQYPSLPPSCWSFKKFPVSPKPPISQPRKSCAERVRRPVANMDHRIWYINSSCQN